MGKAAHLSTPDEAASPEAAPPSAADVVGTFTVGNQHGLHARPAARLVSEVGGLDATVTLTNLTTGAGPVPAGSLSRVAMLGAQRGHEVEVRAAGPQAQEAVEHLVALAARRTSTRQPRRSSPSLVSRPGPSPARPASPSARSAGSPLRR